MPQLTLKGVNRIGSSAGTEALGLAGDLFNRAFSKFGSAAQPFQEAEQARFTEESDVNTQDLINQLRGVSDVAEVSNIERTFLDQADTQFGNRFDRAKVSAEIGGLEGRINKETTEAFELENLRRGQATQQFLSGIEGQDLTIQPGQTSSEGILRSISKIDNLVKESNTPFSEQGALRASLMGSANISPDAMIQSIFDELPTKDKTGKDTDIDAALTAGVNRAFGQGLVSDTQINSFIAAKEAATGVDVAKATTAAIATEQRKLENALELQRRKPVAEADYAKTAQDAINLFIDEDVFNLIGTSDREDAQEAVGSAMRAGVPIGSIGSILQKTGRSTFGGNLDLEQLRAELNVEIEKAVKANLLGR